VSVMSSSLNKDGGPVLDEATFQKLLAAAYVVQTHQDRHDGEPSSDTKSQPDSDSTTTLAEIVETQHQIHSSHLDLAGAMNLVAERIRKITGAQGAAIGILDQDKIVYQAGSGSLSPQVGATLRPEATLSAASLVHNAILRCADAATDFLVNPEITRRLGIGSLIAVPVFHDGKTSGTLELVFAKPNAFHENDVRTCQLMAGLVTEALTHAAEEEWRKGVAAERASMLQVLEKIKPQLARLAQDPNAGASPESAAAHVDGLLEASTCQHCGHELAPGEVFCGACGTSRSTSARSDLQSKWATLWNLKKIGSHLTAASAEDPLLAESVLKAIDPSEPPSSEPDSFILPEKPASMAPPPAPFEPAKLPEPEANFAAPAPPEDPAVPPVEEPPEPIPVAERKPEPRVWFHSIAVSPPAVQLKGFLEKHRGILRKHPGDLALVAAGVLFVITIIWAVSSNHPTTSADTGNPQAAANAANTANAPAKPKRKPAPAQPQLSLFDQFLVSVGLAEPPPAPSHSGNPNIPVWVDVHTAQYYCPGSDLYGKTPQGRIASQHDAQMDQFEPASRKVCD
jgi:GAF domain-containing protein